mmetsp:Transcript_13588/g.29519  ORF Transcript_13588/g.29519 Transcript_13588/m.29519 type:complete len:111 (-) Transcript_13588:790-1122(-)
MQYRSKLVVSSYMLCMSCQVEHDSQPLSTCNDSSGHRGTSTRFQHVGNASCEQEVLVVLAYEQLAELVVGERTDTEGGEDAEGTSEGNRAEILLDQAPPIGGRYVGRGGS